MKNARLLVLISSCLDSIIELISLSDSLAEECLSVLLQIRQSQNSTVHAVFSKTISLVLLSSSPQLVLSKINNSEILQGTSPSEVRSNLLIIDFLLNSNSKDIIEPLLPKAIQIIHNEKDNPDMDVRTAYCKVLVSVCLSSGKSFPKFVPLLLSSLDGLDNNSSVLILQEFSRLKNLNLQQFPKEKELILKKLLEQYRSKYLAIQSASASSLFAIFFLEELDTKELQSLAEFSQNVDLALKDFNQIILDIQADRAKAKIVRS